MNANHSSKFTSLRIMYIAYQVTLCWRQWNHAIHKQRYIFR